MTETEFRRMFPKASVAFASANSHLVGQNQQENALQGNVARSSGKRGTMNQTEKTFQFLLKARFPDCEIRFEAYKLRIGERCYYCPDFAVIHLSGLIDFYECKGGHIWEDSLIKCKAAKEMYQHHLFEMWQCKKGSWTQIL